MHGIAHIGVIQEIEARGLRVDVVTGTSVGALVGSLWASGVDGERIAALGRDSNFQEWAGFAGSWQGLLTSDGLRAPLEAAFQGRPIESWPKRFGAVATNIATGKRRVLSSGDGPTAVQASSAVPVLYQPVVVAGERLVDGALVEPVPAATARELGADVVIAVDVAYRPHEEAARGMTQYAFQAMHILVNSLATAQLAAADVVLRMDLHQHYVRCGNESLIAAGRAAVAAAWPDIARAVVRRAPKGAARP